uniref:Ig-like domain-containing protein n=1 Tax=Anas zonorhyncha TaxID=75864 RepID=A0A8C0A0F3_9AVES
MGREECSSLPARPACVNCLPLPSDAPCPVCPSWSPCSWLSCFPGAAFEEPSTGPCWLCLHLVSLPCKGCQVLAGVAQGRYTGHCMGMSHVTSHGTMPRALNGSISQEHFMERCVGTLHRGGKRGSPTTDPIPIPAQAQPQVRIIPAETGNASVPVCLSCHIWGFYPPEVTVIWLHNGDIVEPDDYNPISAIPNGDWSYQTQVSLLVVPVAGDTYTCSDWSEWRGAGPHPEAGGLGLQGNTCPSVQSRQTQIFVGTADRDK